LMIVLTKLHSTLNRNITPCEQQPNKASNLHGMTATHLTHNSFKFIFDNSNHRWN